MAGTAMDEGLWYSRLILWVGAIILLAEAVSGRAVALFTVVGTLCLAGGFVAFLAALALGGVREKREPAAPAASGDPERRETES